MFIARLYNTNTCNHYRCKNIFDTKHTYYANNIPVQNKISTQIFYGNNVQVCEECYRKFSRYTDQKQLQNIKQDQLKQTQTKENLEKNIQEDLQKQEPDQKQQKQSGLMDWPWLSYVEGTRGPDEGILGKNFGWDDKGLWFSGDAGSNTPAYPIYTSFTISEKCRTEISVDFIYDDYESKNFGLCVYLDGTIPEWKWEYPNPTRIAGQYDSNMSGPSISAIKNTNETEMAMEFDTVYICKFMYDPLTKPNIVMDTYMRCKLDEQNNPMPTTDNPVLLDSKYLNECLPPGDYRVGFTADNDILPPNRTYLQNLSIRVIYNAEKEFVYEHPLTTIDSLSNL